MGVRCEGREVRLTGKEFALLAARVESAGRVATRKYLPETVWGTPRKGSSARLTYTSAALRQSLGACGERIETLSGVGYRFRRNAEAGGEEAAQSGRETPGAMLGARAHRFVVRGRRLQHARAQFDFGAHQLARARPAHTLGRGDDGDLAAAAQVELQRERAQEVFGRVEAAHKPFDESGALLDQAYGKRIDQFLKELIWMASHLRHGRENVPL